MADDSDSSSLSSAPDEEVKKLAPIFLKAKQAKNHYVEKSSPPRPKRPASPPHEEVLADNVDIPFIVMFRSRFSEAFSGKLAHFGPQEIESGVVDTVPSPQVEGLLCALLGLVLNRKKPVERGHHGRALEEAVLSQKSQWPHSWRGIHPLHGNRDFNTMSPVERLNLLRTLIIWSLTSSEAIATIIKEKYKQNRHGDDENQPLSVQPWGMDGDKRRYFLIQGLEDTRFRVYREGSRYTKNAHWWSVAGTIAEVKALATKLEEVDGTQNARRLANRITAAVPMFEMSEEKRLRREYRQEQRKRFTRPEPGFSLYEGRTRGKRMRYTYDDEEGGDSDATSTRRSARHSTRNTPFDTGPTYTASGRQVRQPRTGEYGEGLLSNGAGNNSTDELAPDYPEDEDDQPVRPGGRAMRSAGRPAVNGARKRKHSDGSNSIDDMSEEDEAGGSGNDWDSDQNEAEDENMPDADDEEASDEEDDEDDEPQSLLVKLSLRPSALAKCDGPQHKHLNGTEETKPSLGNGAHDPLPTTREPVGTDEAANAGASRTEPIGGASTVSTNRHADTAVKETIASQPPRLTPPTAASAYPTPASGSFPSADIKHSVPASVTMSTAALNSAPAPPVQHVSAVHQE